MPQPVDSQSVRAQTIAEVRRAALENKLSKAIEKARNQYVSNAQPLKPEAAKPAPGPSHLGRNIDIRV